MRLAQKLFRDINQIIIENIYLDYDEIDKKIQKYIDDNIEEIDSYEAGIDIEIKNEDKVITIWIFDYGAEYFCLRNTISRINQYYGSFY